MKIRKLSSWSSWADNHAWFLVGVTLKEKAIEALGRDRVVDQFFGNVIGWLRDIGEYELAAEIKMAIVDYNAQYECPTCGGDLQYDQQARQQYCGAHGYVYR